MYSTGAFWKKRPMNRKFDHCVLLILRFIGKASWILANYTWLERRDSHL